MEQNIYPPDQYKTNPHSYFIYTTTYNLTYVLRHNSVIYNAHLLRNQKCCNSSSAAELSCAALVSVQFTKVLPPGSRPGQLHPGQGRPTSPAEAGRSRPVSAPARTLPVPDLFSLQWISAEYLEKTITKNTLKICDYNFSISILYL